MTLPADGHPAAARLVEVGREAERDRAEVAPELGEVRIPDRVVGPPSAIAASSVEPTTT